jgi:hypothetical protein
MAEKTILVCDECGRPAAETVTIKLSRGNLVKDLCSTHIDALVAGARRPRPGRRKGAVATPAKAKSSATSAGAAPKKRGRPRTKADA